MALLRLNIFTLLLLLTFCGCAGTKKSLPPTQLEKPSLAYVIGPEDILEISVWQNQDLTRTVTVRPDGMISLPLVGDVQVAGFTPERAKQEINKSLKPFVGDPIVAVIVQAINSWRIYVQGEVRTPGVFPIQRHTTLSQAIPMAGGFTEFAKKRKIQVIRNKDGQSRMIKVNYNKIVSGKRPEEDILLHPGDTIIVP